MTDSVIQPSPRAARPAHLLMAAFVILLSLRFLHTGEGPASTGLDPSWTAVLSWATLHGKQFGSEIVFTYGPLGFLHPYPSSYPGTYGWYLLGQLVLAPACAYPIALCLVRATPPVRIALIVACLAWLPWLQADSAWMLFFAASAVVIAGDWQRSFHVAAFRAALFGATAAALSLIKFTNLVAAMLAVVLVIVMAVVDRRRRAALAFAVSMPLALLALWLATGQKVSGLADYVTNLIEIVSGYAAMAMAPAAPADLLGIILLLVSGTFTAAMVLRARNPADAAATFFLGCILFLSWRSAFSRASVNPFIPLAASIPLYAIVISNGVGARFSRYFAPVLTLFTLIIGWNLVREIPVDKALDEYAKLPRNLAQYLSPRQTFAMREVQWQQQAGEHALPTFAKRIGGERVDLLMYEQGIVLLNAFAYAPRPVFQSYAAYSPDLQRRNLAYFEGPQAPPWVILKIRTIDGRLPTLDDGPALVSILRTYRLVAKERGYLLFKRERAPSSLPALTEVVSKRQVQLGDWNDLPTIGKGQLLVARIDVRSSLPGKAYGAVLRQAPLWLDLAHPDGKTSSFNLPAPMASAGFILSPVLRNNFGLLRTYRGDEDANAVRFRIRTSESRPYPALFDSTATVSLSTTAYLLPEQAELKAMMNEWGPIFGGDPVAVQGDPEFTTEDGRAAVFLHAPASLTFERKPGRYRIEIGFGIRASALTHPNCVSGNPDGVRMSVYSASTNALLGSRTINPFAHDADRGSQSLRIDNFELTPGGIVLRMEPGADGTSNRSCDWGYIDRMSLVELTPNTH